MSKRNFKKDDIIEIEWTDAATTQGWCSPDRLTRDNGLSPCKTVGYFFRKTKNSIQTSKGTSGDDRCDTQSIPLAGVKKIRKLK